MNTAILILLAIVLITLLFAVSVAFICLVLCVFWHDDEASKKFRETVLVKIQNAWKDSWILRWSSITALVCVPVIVMIFIILFTRL